MKSLRILSIIGIIWFSFCFIIIVALLSEDAEASAGWGIFALLYSIPLSIVGLVKTSSGGSRDSNIDKLFKLSEMKKEGLISEEEFNFKKRELLK